MQNEEGIFTHGAMTYKCQKCGKEWRMFLECGVETCKSTVNSSRCIRCKNIHKMLMPSPFIIACLCGGTAEHVDWHKDTHFPLSMPVSDYMSYFRLDREGLEKKNPMACGIPVLRKDSGNMREQEGK
jgi:hypothetical protein